MIKASPTQPSETLPLDNRHPPWLDRRQFPFTSRFIEIEGHRVHYVDEGSGATILFLHGNFNAFVNLIIPVGIQQG